MMVMMMIRLCQFTGVGSSTEKGGMRELKVREAGEQGTGGGRFWPPCPPPQAFALKMFLSCLLPESCPSNKLWNDEKIGASSSVPATNNALSSQSSNYKAA